MAKVLALLLDSWIDCGHLAFDVFGWNDYLDSREIEAWQCKTNLPASSLYEMVRQCG